jgi:hypothetical protein
MPDPVPPAAPGGAPPLAAPGAAPAWHNGVDADTAGFWQNKGWKTEDPKAFATELTKSYRELEKHFGVPPDQLAKLPGPTSKPEDVRAFWGKLGVPAKPEDYDFSTVKIDGQALSDDLVASLRASLASANVAKDKASSIAEAFVKWMNDGDTREKTVLDGRITREKQELEKSWGANHQYNLLMADQGARKFGLSQEEVSAISERLGVARTAEMFRQIGEGLKEAPFVGGSPGQVGPPRTAEGAQARLNELKADKDWNARMVSGRYTPAEREEFLNLSAMAAGEQRII